MFKFFKPTTNVDIHMLVDNEGEQKYVSVEENTTMRDAHNKVNEIAFGLNNPKVNVINEGIEATGYTPDGRKVVIAAYDQESFKAGSIDY